MCRPAGCQPGSAVPSHDVNARVYDSYQQSSNRLASMIRNQARAKTQTNVFEAGHNCTGVARTQRARQLLTHVPQPVTAKFARITLFDMSAQSNYIWN